MAKSTDNTASAVVPFLFEGDTLVRVEMRNGDPWFVATDLAVILGYRDAEKATRMLEEDEKDTLPGGTLCDERRAAFTTTDRRR
jgi:prophage antirepressor-like protein